MNPGVYSKVWLDSRYVRGYLTVLECGLVLLELYLQSSVSVSDVYQHYSYHKPCQGLILQNVRFSGTYTWHYGRYDYILVFLHITFLIHLLIANINFLFWGYKHLQKTCLCNLLWSVSLDINKHSNILDDFIYIYTFH